MENSLSKVFDSDESRSYLHIEKKDDDSFLEDELSTSMDFCIVEDDNCMEKLSENIPSSENATEPQIGMDFSSKDDAREFYIAYGRRTGFTVRTHHNRRSRVNNMVISQDFVCSKEGFREKKYVQRKDRVLPPPPVTREGCPAMLRVALRDGVKWIVTKFVKDHNHSLLSPGKVPWRGSGRNVVSEDEKDQRIRELTLELYNERQRCKRKCAAYEERLQSLLKFIEDHTQHLSRTVEEIVERVKEIENKQVEDPN